jgi:hypothetical protein
MKSSGKQGEELTIYWSRHAETNEENGPWAQPAEGDE